MKPIKSFLTPAAAKSRRRRLLRLSSSAAFAIAPAMILALLGSPTAKAQTTYTWTGYNNTTSGAATSETWGDTANWDTGAVYLSGANNELMFFDDTNAKTYFTGSASLEQEGSMTITGVPSLTMGTLTLDGRGPNSTISTAIIIGDNSAIWTIGNGTTGTVNLTSIAGGGGDRFVNHTVNPNITLAQTTDFTGGGGGIQGFNFTGNITDGGSGFGINKSGNSRLVLSGNNTYTGTTTVSGGLLRLSSANALAGGIGVSGGTSALTINGGVVELASGDFTRNLGTGSDQFQITGGTSGFSALGAPRFVTVNNDAATELVWGSTHFNPSNLVLNASTADSALTLSNKIDLNGSTRTVQVNANTAVLAGDIQNSSSTAGLTKSGGGRLVLSGTNTYNGSTTITSGTLSVGATNNLGDASAGLVFNGGTLQVTGTALTNISGIGHTVTFNGGKTMGFDIADSANTFTVDQAISGSTLIKAGGGNLVLNDAIFTGQTKISGGGTLVLDYGSGQDTAKLATNQNLTLSGGALILRGGTSAETVKGTILEIGNTTISRDGGSTGTIDLKGISVGLGETLAIAEGGFAKTSSSTTDGIFNKGAITVGSDFADKDVNGFLVAYSGYTTATLAGGGDRDTNNQLTGGGTLNGTITSNALRISNTGNSDVLEAQNNDLSTENGGTILYAGGFDNNYTINGGSGAEVRTINGNQPLIVNTYVGTLTVNTRLTSGGGSTLTKTGAGTLVVGGSNSYTGNTYINQGSLRLANDAGAGTTSNGITVQNGAALELSNNINVVAEALAISGTGISNGGALRNFSGTNTYGGAITAGAGGARINSDSGTDLTLTGGIATAPVQDVTFGGAGNTTVSTAGISGMGGLNKDGAGSLTLSASNTYTGATQVSVGTLYVNGALKNSVVTVTGTGILGGTNTISQLINVASTGTLAPGASIGTLTAGGNVDLDGTLNVEYGTVNIDMLAVLGELDLSGGTSNASFLDFAGALDGTSSYTFATYGTLVGTFATNNAPAGYSIDYAFGGNNIALVVIPEPHTALLSALGLLALLRRKR